ncbi:hypothetical protein PsYK624_107550 [Phanerochaete sordida]|uniref:Uncharacterized protein n=1 Tax=Phanerochaete sordida TaxID=48140 RepID=A0A9P3LGR3_9APHY|nr:hypothetical protein PsYK624_107550 [Phanerochaete sordida]
MDRLPGRPLSGWYKAFWEDRINEHEIPTRDAMHTYLTDYATNTDIEAVSEYINAVGALNQLQTFRAMLDGTAVPHSRERHCVRCHAPYTEATNTYDACQVAHAYNAHGYFTGTVQRARVYEFKALCCEGVVLREQGQNSKRYMDVPEPCFRGRHTTDVAIVEETYNRINIARCKLDDTGKCVRAHVVSNLDQPLLTIRPEEEEGSGLS